MTTFNVLKSKFIVLALTLFGLLFIDTAQAQWSLGTATATSLNAGTINITDSLRLATGDLRFRGYGRIYFYDGSWISSGDSLNFSTATAAPAGSDTYIQFNDGGALGADAGIVYAKATNVLTVGNVQVDSVGVVDRLIIGSSADIDIGSSGGGTITVKVPSDAETSFNVTIPDAATNAYFVLTKGNQTVDGIKAFSKLAVGTGTKITALDSIKTAGGVLRWLKITMGTMTAYVPCYSDTTGKW